MTISEFANAYRPENWASWGIPLRRRHREQKRLEAEDRQAAFDADVARVAYEQNCDPITARDVVRARHRFEHKRSTR